MGWTAWPPGDVILGVYGAGEYQGHEGGVYSIFASKKTPLIIKLVLRVGSCKACVELPLAPHRGDKSPMRSRKFRLNVTPFGGGAECSKFPVLI